MNRMKRMTIGLLGAGLLLGATAVRAEEKAPAAAAEDKEAAAAAYRERLLASPWTEMREPYQEAPRWSAKDREAFKKRQHSAVEELSKRRNEVVRQIDEGKLEEVFPTVFDVVMLLEWMNNHVAHGQSSAQFQSEWDQLLEQAGMKERAAAQRLMIKETRKKYLDDARREYEPALKAAIEANPEWAVAGRRLKEAKAKLDALGINERGEPKGGSPKSPGETPDKQSLRDKTAAADAAKEYQEAKQRWEAFEKTHWERDLEYRLLRQAVEDVNPYEWMLSYIQPVRNGWWSSLMRDRHLVKIKIGLLGSAWLLAGRPDPAPDPALPRIDDSVRKPGTAKSLDLGPSTGSGQGNNVKLELVWIPAGEFMMGSPTNEPGRSMDERLHRVKLTKGFWMGKYEVTQEQWQRVMGNNPSFFRNAGPRAPVEMVTRDQAQKFMLKLGEMTAGQAGGAGGKFRFPTEAEWEWACRAGTTTALHTGKMTIKGGNNSPEVGAVAWYAGNSAVEYEGSILATCWPDKEQEYHFAGTHPVGQKQPNAWGLYDMLGNVAEYCPDMHDAYPPQAVTDPTGGPGAFGRIIRGGSFEHVARLCRSAARDFTVPIPWWRTPMIGFRVVMDEPPAGPPAEKAK